MRSRRYKEFEGDDSSYDLSISDLMAALCSIFVLFTVGITSSLREKNASANMYNETKVTIGNKIEDALQDSIDKGMVTFDKEKLILRFSADRAFEQNKPDLKPGFERDLDKIFPVLMKALYESGKRDDIEEVKIEGFTATDRGDNPSGDYSSGNPYIRRFRRYGEASDHDYITGFTLSQQRTMNVLSYCMLTDYMKDISRKERPAYKDWVRNHVTASGYSFIQPLDKNGKVITLEEQNALTGKDKDESKSRSRRVEIRIKTNADKVVKNLQTIKDSADEK